MTAPSQRILEDYHTYIYYPASRHIGPLKLFY